MMRKTSFFRPKWVPKSEYSFFNPRFLEFSNILPWIKKQVLAFLNHSSKNRRVYGICMNERKSSHLSCLVSFDFY